MIFSTARSRHNFGRLMAVLAIVLGAVAMAHAQEKMTYQDHVLPILRNRCLKCHNPDKTKADLNLATYVNALKGSGNGAVLEGGDPDASKLFLCVTHTEEPTMPPNDKLPDTEIEVIRQWIAGGLLENSGSRAVLSSKPKISLATPGAIGQRPEGPPPMPEDVFALDPYVVTERGSLTTALATSPWAPLVAVGGQHQVFLYHTDTLALVGVVPFTNGFPVDLRFSANGRLLVIGGGRGANLGVSKVWDIVEGRALVTVGEDYDTVLATDISADQQFIAHGGPDRLVKIFSTATGQLVHKIKKHTEWVTAVRFSHDGRYVATGDRNGGLQVWETGPGAAICTLSGHTDWVTGIEWAGSNLLVTASEDRTVRIWNTDEAREIKKWNAHDGGVLSLARTSEGLLVTCGRDGKATLWDANGKRTRDFKFPGDLPTRAVPTHDGAAIVGTDWSGLAYVWHSGDGQEIGRLSLNPPSLAEQGQLASAHLTSCEQSQQRLRSELTTARQELTEAKAQMMALENAHTKAQQAADQVRTRRDEWLSGPLASAKSELENAEKECTQAESRRQGAEAALTNAAAQLNEAKSALEAADRAASAAEAQASSWREDPSKTIEEREQAAALARTKRQEAEEAREALQRHTQDLLEPAQNDLTAAGAALREAEQAKDEAERTWKTRSAEGGLLEAELTAAEATLNQAKDSLRAAQEGALKQSIESLEKTLADLEHKAEESDAALAQARQAKLNWEMRQAYSTYFKRWSPLRPKLDERDDVQAEIEELERTRSRLERELAAAQAVDVDAEVSRRKTVWRTHHNAWKAKERQWQGLQGLAAINDARWQKEEENKRRAQEAWDEIGSQIEALRTELANQENLIQSKRQDQTEWETELQTRLLPEESAAGSLVAKVEQALAAAESAAKEAQVLVDIFGQVIEEKENEAKELDATAHADRIASLKSEVQRLKEMKLQPAAEVLRQAQAGQEEQKQALEKATRLNMAAQSAVTSIKESMQAATNEVSRAQAQVEILTSRLNDLAARETQARTRWEQARADWEIPEAGRHIFAERAAVLKPELEKWQSTAAEARQDWEGFARSHQERLQRLEASLKEKTAKLKSVREQWTALQNVLAPQEEELSQLLRAYQESKSHFSAFEL